MNSPDGSQYSFHDDDEDGTLVRALPPSRMVWDQVRSQLSRQGPPITYFEDGDQVYPDDGSITILTREGSSASTANTNFIHQNPPVRPKRQNLQDQISSYVTQNAASNPGNYPPTLDRIASTGKPAATTKDKNLQNKQHQQNKQQQYIVQPNNSYILQSQYAQQLQSSQYENQQDSKQQQQQQQHTKDLTLVAGTPHKLHVCTLTEPESLFLSASNNNNNNNNNGNNNNKNNNNGSSHTLINTIHFIEDDEHGSANDLLPPPPPDGEFAFRQQQQQQIYVAATHASHVTLSQQSLRWQKPSREQYELNSKDCTTLYHDAYLCFEDLTPQTTANITNTTKETEFFPNNFNAMLKLGICLVFAEYPINTAQYNPHITQKICELVLQTVEYSQFQQFACYIDAELPAVLPIEIPHSLDPRCFGLLLLHTAASAPHDEYTTQAALFFLYIGLWLLGTSLFSDLQNIEQQHAMYSFYLASINTQMEYNLLTQRHFEPIDLPPPPPDAETSIYIPYTDIQYYSGLMLHSIGRALGESVQINNNTCAAEYADRFHVIAYGIWLHAAYQNNPSAMADVAFFRQNVITPCLPQNNQIAFAFMQCAAAHQYPRAMFNLAVYYRRGIGLPQQDPTTATTTTINDINALGTPDQYRAFYWMKKSELLNYTVPKKTMSILTKQVGATPDNMASLLDDAKYGLQTTNITCPQDELFINPNTNEFCGVTFADLLDHCKNIWAQHYPHYLALQQQQPPPQSSAPPTIQEEAEAYEEEQQQQNIPQNSIFSPLPPEPSQIAILNAAATQAYRKAPAPPATPLPPPPMAEMLQNDNNHNNNNNNLPPLPPTRPPQFAPLLIDEDDMPPQQPVPMSTTSQSAALSSRFRLPNQPLASPLPPTPFGQQQQPKQQRQPSLPPSTPLPAPPTGQYTNNITNTQLFTQSDPRQTQYNNNNNNNYPPSLATPMAQQQQQQQPAAPTPMSRNPRASILARQASTPIHQYPTLRPATSPLHMQTLPVGPIDPNNNNFQQQNNTIFYNNQNANVQTPKPNMPYSRTADSNNNNNNNGYQYSSQNYQQQQQAPILQQQNTMPSTPLPPQPQFQVQQQQQQFFVPQVDDDIPPPPPPPEDDDEEEEQQQQPVLYKNVPTQVRPATVSTTIPQTTTNNTTTTAVTTNAGKLRNYPTTTTSVALSNTPSQNGNYNNNNNNNNNNPRSPTAALSISSNMTGRSVTSAGGGSSSMLTSPRAATAGSLKTTTGGPPTAAEDRLISIQSIQPITRNEDDDDERWRKRCLYNYKHVLARLMSVTFDGYITNAAHVNILAELRVLYGLTQQDHQECYRLAKQLWDRRKAQQIQQAAMYQDPKTMRKTMNLQAKMALIEERERDLEKHKATLNARLITEQQRQAQERKINPHGIDILDKRL